MLGESPISFFMVTIGLASILVGVVELVWGADQLRLPDFMPAKHILIGEAMVSPKIFYGALIAGGLIAHRAAGVPLLARRRRAAGNCFGPGGGLLHGDQRAARVLAAWMPAAMIAAWPASSWAPSRPLAEMGVFGLSVLVVVIFGGLDSVLGALVGGLIVGVVES